jgi:DNA-binding CsgD family transcriptional regulator
MGRDTDPRTTGDAGGPAAPLTGIFDLSDVPQTEVRFDRFLDEVCASLGFDYAAYAGINPIDRSVHGYVNYPSSWQRHYHESGLHRVDPTLQMARRSIAPVDWRRLREHDNFRTVFAHAQDFGIGDLGVTIPVRGPYGDVGMLSVTRKGSVREWEGLIRSAIGELQSAAVHLHDAAMRSDALSGILRRPMLSRREVEILQWVAAGKSQQDVADILGIAQRTVEVHLASARDKLGALNTPQAAARAVSLGLIYPL